MLEDANTIVHAEVKMTEKTTEEQRAHAMPLLLRSLQEMIDEADHDGDGKGNEEEFLRIMKSPTGASGSSASQGTPRSQTPTQQQVPRSSSTEPCRPRMVFAGPGSLPSMTPGPTAGTDGQRHATHENSDAIDSRRHHTARGGGGTPEGASEHSLVGGQWISTTCSHRTFAKLPLACEESAAGQERSGMDKGQWINGSGDLMTDDDDDNVAPSTSTAAAAHTLKPAGILKNEIQDDEGDEWTVKGSKKKKKGAKVTFNDPGKMKCSRKEVRRALQEQGGRSSPETKFVTNLQALEIKRGHQEKSSAGSAPAPVVTTTTDIGPIDALTFDKINTVASIGGTPAAPDKLHNWRYVELLVDSGAVDNVGDPRAFPEYKLRESEGSRNGLHYLAANNGKIKNEGELNLSCRSSEWMPFQRKMHGAEVSRPILTVIRRTESGKDIISEKNGGYIRDTQRGVTTTFRRNSCIYVMGVWVKTGPDCAANTGNPKAGFAWRT